MNNLTKTKKEYFPKKEESDDKNAVAIENCTTIGLRLARVGCVDEHDAMSLGINSK